MEKGEEEEEERIKTEGERGLVIVWSREPLIKPVTVCAHVYSKVIRVHMYEGANS